MMISFKVRCEVALVAFILFVSNSNANDIRGRRSLDGTSPPTGAPTQTPRCTPYFSLLDVSTQKRVSVLCNGDVIHISEYSEGMTVVLNPAATKTNFGRVAYYLNGIRVSDQYGNYALFGGRPYKAWKATAGQEYLIKVILYRGLRLAHKSFNITVQVAE